VYLTEHVKTSRQGQSEHPNVCISWLVLIR